jgi:hypothetical protein
MAGRPEGVGGGRGSVSGVTVVAISSVKVVGCKR